MENRYDYDLLSFILNIKMAVDGSWDGFSYEEIKNKINWLQLRLKEWSISGKTNPKDIKFSLTVKSLLEQSLDIYFGSSLERQVKLSIFQ